MKINEITESRYGPILILVALSFIIYINTLFNGYVFDDFSVILENKLIRDFKNIPRFIFADVWIFDETHKASNYYRPVYNISLTIQYHLWGLNAWGWHLGNIILHTLNSAVAFLTFSLIFEGFTSNSTYSNREGKLSTTTFALMAALVFAAHPVKTEAVAWITASSELLPALFVLLSFYLYIRSLFKDSKASYVLSVVTFFIAALCKETSMSLPILIVAFDIAVRARSIRQSVIRYIPFFLAGLLYFVIRIYSLETMIPKGTVHPYLNGFQFFINVFPLFIQHIKTLLLPIKLSVYHVFHPAYAIGEIKVIASMIATVLIFILSYRLKKRNVLFPLGLSIIIIPLLPALFIPALDRNPFAERYLYLPTLGFSLIIALVIREGVDHFTSKKSVNGVRFFIWAFIILIALYSSATVKRNFEWKDQASLWESSIKRDPKNYFALNQLGRVYLDKGEFDEAIPKFQASIEINRSRRDPDPLILGLASLSLADSYRMNNRPVEAINLYEEVIRMDARRFDANLQAAILYHERGDHDLALERYRTALERAKDKEDITGILMNIGNIYAKRNEWTKALDIYSKALKVDPQNPILKRNIQLIERKMSEQAE